MNTKVVSLELSILLSSEGSRLPVSHYAHAQMQVEQQQLLKVTNLFVQW